MATLRPRDARDICHADPAVLSGTPVFRGTRVPVASLFDYLAGGDSLEDFLTQFPGVDRAQAEGALQLGCAAVLALARSPGPHPAPPPP